MEEAEELSRILYQHFKAAQRRRSGKEIAKVTLDYCDRLEDCIDAQKQISDEE